MSKIDKLKYAIFNEWSYDPPGGGMTLYYDARGTTYREIMWPVSETYDHLSSGVYDEEAEELEKAYDAVKASKNSIENYSWENGGLGCGCDFIVEGKEIAKKAADFYYSELQDWFEDDAEEETINLYNDIIKKAVENPADYDAVEALLDMISEAIEKKNDAMY